MTAYVRFGNALAWHAAETARGLQAAGHDVLLFCQRHSPLAEWTRDAPFAVNDELNLNRFWPHEFIGATYRLRAALREFQPDVLNPHCPPGHSYLASLRPGAAPQASLIRTVADPRPPASNWFNRRLHCAATDGIVYTTRTSRQRYAALLADSAVPQEIILPGFRAADFAQGVTPRRLREELSLRADALLIGVIARMSPEKGQEVLLRALALLPSAERARIHCILSGEDSRERGAADLAALAKSLDVERNVTFMPRQNDVRPLMAALDLGLVTSIRSEAICRVALEYMSFGLPVIAGDVNILPEVVRHEATGWIYPHKNPAALAEVLRGAVANETLRRRYGEAGRQRVHGELSAGFFMNRTLDFYDRIIAMKRNRRP